ncbi:MAG: MXAN_6640 family putative metalloprotease [Archangium sp.]
MRAASLLSVLVLSACEPPVDGRQPIAVSREEALRPTDTNSGLLWRYANGDVVDSVANDGGTFRVHYTLAGINAVPSMDFARQVEDVYEEVGALYHGPLGYRPPLSDAAISPNGGDARFDVYLLDFAGQADGTFRVDQCPPDMVDRCIGYVAQENDFAGYGYPSLVTATRILGSHEYFHAVQAAYDSDQDVVVSEGTAVWATERFDPSTSDFEHFVGGYLADPGRSLDNAPIGPVPSFAYGSAIFFKFLTERHDDAIIRKLWEHLENGKGHASEPADQANPTWLVQLDAILKSDYQSSFAAEFREFAKWNLFTNTAADATQSYANATTFPIVTMETVQLPYLDAPARFYYAATKYFFATAQGRTLVTAQLVDHPLTPVDDTEDLTVWMTVRRAGKNEQLTQVTAGQTVDVTGAAVIVAVANTRRGKVGTASTQRPGVCIGTPEEVATCVTAIRGEPPDAGMSEIDAGVETDAGVEPPPPPMGCGCGMGGGPLALLALAVTRLFNRGARNA